jgi:prevent-host-death family protein
MASVGVRELRQRASELLRRVEAGETIEVTDRGRPVAVLAPIPGQGPLERLLASGDLIPGRSRGESFPAPLPLPRAMEAPSKILERQREERLRPGEQ